MNRYCATCDEQTVPMRDGSCAFCGEFVALRIAKLRPDMAGGEFPAGYDHEAEWQRAREIGLRDEQHTMALGADDQRAQAMVTKGWKL